MVYSVQYIMTADMVVIVVMYIYILYEESLCIMFYFLDWHKLMSWPGRHTLYLHH